MGGCIARRQLSRRCTRLPRSPSSLNATPTPFCPARSTAARTRSSRPGTATRRRRSTAAVRIWALAGGRGGLALCVPAWTEQTVRARRSRSTLCCPLPPSAGMDLQYVFNGMADTRTHPSVVSERRRLFDRLSSWTPLAACLFRGRVAVKPGCSGPRRGLPTDRPLYSLPPSLARPSSAGDGARQGGAPAGGAGALLQRGRVPQHAPRACALRVLLLCCWPAAFCVFRIPCRHPLVPTLAPRLALPPSVPCSPSRRACTRWARRRRKRRCPSSF